MYANCGPSLTSRRSIGKYSALVVCCVIVFTCFTYFILHASGVVSVFLAFFSTSAIFLGELFRRVLPLCGVWLDTKTLSEGKAKRAKLLGKWISQDYSVLLLFALFTTIALAFYHYQDNNQIISNECGAYVVLFYHIIAVMPVLGYLADTTGELETYKNNLADGLAWSYYFGYLKMILPELDKAVSGSTHEVRANLNHVKLFILLPENCYCPATLEEVDQNIKHYINLPAIEKDMGGIKKRSYHQTVYKITIPEKGYDKKYVGEYFCLVEYATPLSNLYKMARETSAQLSEEERIHQVKMFDAKLRDILDRDDQCKGKYELVPISDDDTTSIAMKIVQLIKNNPVDVVETIASANT